MELTKRQEMLAENLRNGSIQAFAEGREVERENFATPGRWHSMPLDACFLPDCYRYRVKRTPAEWWEVRYASGAQYSTRHFPSHQACIEWIGGDTDLMIVHVREEIE